MGEQRRGLGHHLVVGPEEAATTNFCKPDTLPYPPFKAIGSMLLRRADHQPFERVVSMVLGRADELCAEPSSATDRGRM